MAHLLSLLLCSFKEEKLEHQQNSWYQLLLMSKVEELHSWLLHFHQVLVKRYLGIL